MKNHLLITLFITLSISSFAQTDKYIELVVSEIVELKAQRAILTIARKETRYYEEDGYEVYSYDNVGYYQDEEYHRLMKESPKKVTPEMQQAYEDRQKQYEITNQERTAKKAASRKRVDDAWEKFLENLNTENIEFSAKNNKFIADWYTNENYEDSDISDLIHVTVQNEEQYNKVIELSTGLAVYIRNHEIIYEKIEGKLPAIIQNLSKKAKSEAEIIAQSLNKKLGSVLNVSNLVPSHSVARLNSEYNYNAFEVDDRYQGKTRASPFSITRKTSVIYVYRFALLD